MGLRHFTKEWLKTRGAHPLQTLEFEVRWFADSRKFFGIAEHLPEFGRIARHLSFVIWVETLDWAHDIDTALVKFVGRSDHGLLRKVSVLIVLDGLPPNAGVPAACTRVLDVTRLLFLHVFFVSVSFSETVVCAGGVCGTWH